MVSCARPAFMLINDKKIVNTPKEYQYLVVRLQLVHVKKSMFGVKDKCLAKHAIIPNTPQESLKIHKRLLEIMQKYGVTLECKK